MDNNNNKDLGEKVVKNISKDFRVFNKSRVHTWYAWGIIGLIIGSVIAVAYVANRSGEFTESEAALRVRVVGSVDEGAVLHPVAHKSDVKWLANTKSETAVKKAGVYKLKGSTKYTTNSAYRNQYLAKTKKYAVLTEPDGDTWLATKSGGSFTINTNDDPTIDLDDTITYTVKAVFVNQNGKRSDVGVKATVYPAVYAGESINDRSWNAYNHGRDIPSNGAITVPAGMPFYGIVTFTDIGGKNKKMRKNIVFPSATEDATRTFVLRSNGNGGYKVANVKMKTAAGEVDDTDSDDTGTGQNTSSDTADTSTGSSAASSTTAGSATSGSSSSLLMASSTLVGSTSPRDRGRNDDIARVILSTSSSTVTNPTIKFNLGKQPFATVSALGNVAFTASLVRTGTNTVLATDTCSPSLQQCTVTFTPSVTVSRTQTLDATLRIDSSDFSNRRNIADTLNVVLRLGDDSTTVGAVSYK